MIYSLLVLIFRLKYSMTRIGVLQIFILLVLMQLLSSCHSLPIDREKSDDNPWWCEPCKQLHFKTRHSRQIRTALRDQFDTTIHRFKIDTQLYMNEILRKITNSTKGQFPKNRWLPHKSFFKKIIRGDNKILPELHKNIQLYAATIQRLNDMKINTQDIWLPMKYREQNFTYVKSYLNALRCDIEEEIFENGLEDEMVQLKKEDLDGQIHLPLEVDNLLNGLVKDYTVLKDYKNFLKKCRTKLFPKSRRNKRRNRNKNKNGEKLEKINSKHNSNRVQS